MGGGRRFFSGPPPLATPCVLFLPFWQFSLHQSMVAKKHFLLWEGACPASPPPCVRPSFFLSSGTCEGDSIGFHSSFRCKFIPSCEKFIAPLEGVHFWTPPAYFTSFVLFLPIYFGKICTRCQRTHGCKKIISTT